MRHNMSGISTKDVMSYLDPKMRGQNLTGAEGDRPLRVSIIIVNYRGADDTIECLESLLRSSWRDFEIVIVDNASGDGSIERLTSWIGGRDSRSIFTESTSGCSNQSSVSAPSIRVSLIETETNLGFSGGNNTGILQALQRKVDWILLLNNDTVTEPDTLVNLLKGAEDSGADLAGCPIWEYGRAHMPWCGGGRFGWWADRYDSTVPATYSGGTSAFETDWITGCCLLVRRHVFEQIGLLDDNLFLYCEDADFSRRAAYAGFKRVIVTGAKIYHKGGRSAGFGSPLARYHSTRSRIYCHLKHHSLLSSLAFLAVFTFSRIFRTMEWLIGGRPDLAAATWCGLCDGLLVKGKSTFSGVALDVGKSRRCTPNNKT